MKNRQLRHPASHSRGITLIEILLALGLLVILLSFAVPSFSGAAVKAEMKVLVDNVQHSLQMARNVARTLESPVEMNLSPDSTDQRQTITFTSRENGSIPGGLQIQDLVVPADFALVSDRDSFVFDQRGLVEYPGRILLVSKTDETVTSTIQVQ